MNESIELQRIYSYVKRSLILMNADENLLLTSALFYSPLFSRFFFFFLSRVNFFAPRSVNGNDGKAVCSVHVL